MIKNAEYVVTDSFHGTAFSIIFRKNLKVVLKSKNKHLNDRLASLLNLFKLNGCIISVDSDEQSLLSYTDYSKSEKIMSEEIKKSKGVISKIIEN